MKLPIKLNDLLRQRTVKELDLTEGRAPGISKILNVMAANGSLPPVFESDDGRNRL
jgi:predicted HTH transcriptional regulator